MPIERLSEQKRVDFKYTGQDGDEWGIVFFDSSERKYVTITNVADNITNTWDAQMLIDLAHSIESIINPPVIAHLHPYQSNGSLLRGPVVLDHRSGSANKMSPEDIQSEIENRINSSRTNNENVKVKRIEPSEVF